MIWSFYQDTRWGGYHYWEAGYSVCQENQKGWWGAEKIPTKPGVGVSGAWSPLPSWLTMWENNPVCVSVSCSIKRQQRASELPALHSHFSQKHSKWECGQKHTFLEGNHPRLMLKPSFITKNKCSGTMFFNQTWCLSFFPIIILPEKENDFMSTKHSWVCLAANLMCPSV